jgi:hypothetical protein
MHNSGIVGGILCAMLGVFILLCGGEVVVWTRSGRMQAAVDWFVVCGLALHSVRWYLRMGRTRTSRPLKLVGVSGYLVRV